MAQLWRRRQGDQRDAREWLPRSGRGGHAHGEPVWRETGYGHGATPDAGLAAIGIEPDTSAAPEPAPKARTPREGTKQPTLIAMLRAPDGATNEEIMAGDRSDTGQPLRQ